MPVAKQGQAWEIRTLLKHRTSGQVVYRKIGGKFLFSKMLSHFEFDGVLSVPEVCQVWYFYFPLQLCWDRKSVKMDTWYGRSSAKTGNFLACDTAMDRGECCASVMMLFGWVGWGVWVEDPYTCYTGRCHLDRLTFSTHIYSNKLTR